MTEHVGSPATGSDHLAGSTAIPSPDRGWPRSFQTDRVELLNRYWHDPRDGQARRSCPTCNAGVTANDYVVHHRGDLYHADCAPYRRGQQ